ERENDEGEPVFTGVLEDLAVLARPALRRELEAPPSSGVGFLESSGMNWKAILAHFDEETFEPRLYWQDLKVGIGGGLNEGVIAAFAAARLALTRDWDAAIERTWASSWSIPTGRRRRPAASATAALSTSVESRICMAGWQNDSS